MSAKAKKQYNLRSHKGTSIQVPVELQVLMITDFLFFWKIVFFHNKLMQILVIQISP